LDQRTRRKGGVNLQVQKRGKAEKRVAIIETGGGGTSIREGVVGEYPPKVDALKGRPEKSEFGTERSQSNIE